MLGFAPLETETLELSARPAAEGIASDGRAVAFSFLFFSFRRQADSGEASFFPETAPPDPHVGSEHDKTKRRPSVLLLSPVTTHQAHREL